MDTSIRSKTNSKAEIQKRVAAGRILLLAPLVMVFARFILALLAQGLIAGIFLLQGDPNPSPFTFIGGLPTWAAAYSLLIWPVIWGITEELTYQGYALPRLEVLTRNTWLAVLIVSFGFGLQHK